MGKRAADLAERFNAFNDEVIRFVEKCPEDDWGKICPGERWPVGVVVRHLAASHYGALGLAKLMVAGEKLPDLTHDVIDQMNAKHAEKHRNCTRNDVLRILRENGRAVADFVGALSEADLDRAGHIAAVGGDVTVEQVVTVIILGNGGEHFTDVKAVAGA